MTRSPGGWRGNTGTTTARGYGWAWQKRREQILDRDKHLCQPCAREGRPTPANEVDHITPKHKGGTDDLGNLEAICNECHKDKTAKEAAEARGGTHKRKRTVGLDGYPIEERQRDFGFSIPYGIEPSRIPVTILSGPPAAGKSTYIKANASPGDLIIDFDVYLDRIGAVKWTKDKQAVKQAFAMRDADLHSLSRRTEGKAWLIATAPTKAERTAWLEALGPRARVVVLDTPAATCIERIKASPERAHAVADMINNVERWFAQRD